MPPKISLAAIEASTAVTPITDCSADATVVGLDKGVKRPLIEPNVVVLAKKNGEEQRRNQPPAIWQ